MTNQQPPPRNAAGRDINGVRVRPTKIAAPVGAPRPKRRWSVWLLTALSISLLVLVAGVVAWQRRQPASANLNNVKTIEQLVARHYVLPTNETPALATVTDPSKVTTNFLKQAHRDDKLLIYQKNSRVIIYRPSLDRIIDVGPVEITPLQPPKT